MIHMKLAFEAAGRGHQVTVSLTEPSLNSSWIERFKPFPKNLNVVGLKFKFASEQELKRIHNELGVEEPLKGLEIVHRILTQMSIEQLEQMQSVVKNSDVVLGDSIMLGGLMQKSNGSNAMFVLTSCIGLFSPLYEIPVDVINEGSGFERLNGLLNYLWHRFVSLSRYQQFFRCFAKVCKNSDHCECGQKDGS